jgi:regulator of replication initiation timing
MKRYTKADLEALVYHQLENLDAMHDLLRLIKEQNELLAIANKKLEEAVSDDVARPYKKVGSIRKALKKKVSQD